MGHISLVEGAGDEFPRSQKSNKESKEKFILFLPLGGYSFDRGHPQGEETGTSTGTLGEAPTC